LKLFESLNRIPDVVFVDGQGLAHPRGLGLASHIGLFLQIPTVGCAKSLLCGVYREPGITKGEKSPIYYKGRFCGYALRTQTRKKPVFVSPGNLVTFEDACRLALMTTTRYRIPEPTRIAHIKVSAYKRGYLSGSQR
jgi:deoxyribonuclease V